MYTSYVSYDLPIRNKRVEFTEWMFDKPTAVYRIMKLLKIHRQLDSRKKNKNVYIIEVYYRYVNIVVKYCFEK